MEMTEGADKSRLESSTIHLLHRAGQCAEEVFAEEFGTDGMTPRQYAVLLTVSQNEGLSQTALVEKTGIDRSTLADVIRRMLKKGLVQRKRTEMDARAYAVRLTAQGREALRDAEPAAQKADRRLLAALAPEELVESVCSVRERMRE
jgi:DNA-binding MarR family transcriptional regulator